MVSVASRLFVAAKPIGRVARGCNPARNGAMRCLERLRRPLPRTGLNLGGDADTA